jgi:DNA-binding XRE family transcriptional regulator
MARLIGFLATLAPAAQETTRDNVTAPLRGMPRKRHDTRAGRAKRRRSRRGGLDLPRLGAWRARRGLTQAELAKASGKAISTVNLVESGRRGAQEETATAFAFALGCQAKDLMREPTR